LKNHPPILRDERGLVEAGDAKGECLIGEFGACRDDRSVFRGTNDNGSVGGLQDLNGFLATFQREDAVAEIVGGAIRVQCEFIEVGILHGVVGVRPADLVAVTDGDERRARENDAAGV
jgi:hypothetical protein